MRLEIATRERIFDVLSRPYELTSEDEGGVQVLEGEFSKNFEVSKTGDATQLPRPYARTALAAGRRGEYYWALINVQADRSAGESPFDEASKRVAESYPGWTAKDEELGTGWIISPETTLPRKLTTGQKNRRPRPQRDKSRRGKILYPLFVINGRQDEEHVWRNIVTGRDGTIARELREDEFLDTLVQLETLTSIYLWGKENMAQPDHLGSFPIHLTF